MENEDDDPEKYVWNSGWDGVPSGITEKTLFAILKNELWPVNVFVA
ncbi:MAG: hypothetical protein GX989_07370 [Firmicutes bacterium]|jgi:hypothetical protein|nr:hypothetical protein [Bacillota bacterium]